MFTALSLPAYAQDCCGPGDGGGGASAVASAGKSGEYLYRLKNVRRYTRSSRRPGFVLGLEAGGIAGNRDAAISPRLEYSGSLGNFDLYGAAFYSVFADQPHSHQADLAGNIAWRFAPDKNSRLIFRLDSENLAVFFPDRAVFAYAALDPGAAYSHAFAFGDISLSLGLPVFIKPEGGLNSWLALAYESPVGLSFSLCPRLALVPEARYQGTTLALGFAWDRFLAKAAFAANESFTAWDIRPYAEFVLGHVVLWAGAEVGGVGTDAVSASPFAGAGYLF
jgi:hypothetical protein